MTSSPSPASPASGRETTLCLPRPDGRARRNPVPTRRHGLRPLAGLHRPPALHPDGRAFRAPARSRGCLSGQDRRAPQGLPRQSRSDLCLHGPCHLRQEFLRGWRRRSYHERWVPVSSCSDNRLAASGAHVACICSSDEVYFGPAEAAIIPNETIVEEIARDLKRVGGSLVYMAGRPILREDALRLAGVHDFIYSGVTCHTGGDDVDIVFEHPGRDTFGASVYVAKKGGTIVTCASTTGLPAPVRQPLPLDEPQADHRLALRQLQGGVGGQPAHRQGPRPPDPVQGSYAMDDSGPGGLRRPPQPAPGQGRGADTSPPRRASACATPRSASSTSRRSTASAGSERRP